MGKVLLIVFAGYACYRIPQALNKAQADYRLHQEMTVTTSDKVAQPTEY